MTSKGAETLGKLLKELFPGFIIKSEVPIKVARKTLFVDFVIPSLNLAFEYDGRQHSEFIPYFHATFSQFTVSKERDSKKSQALSERGYTLIRINYTDKLDAENLRKAIISALES